MITHLTLFAEFICFFFKIRLVIAVLSFDYCHVGVIASLRQIYRSKNCQNNKTYFRLHIIYIDIIKFVISTLCKI